MNFYRTLMVIINKLKIECHTKGGLLLSEISDGWHALQKSTMFKDMRK